MLTIALKSFYPFFSRQVRDGILEGKEVNAND